MIYKPDQERFSKNKSFPYVLIIALFFLGFISIYQMYIAYAAGYKGPINTGEFLRLLIYFGAPIFLYIRSKRKNQSEIEFQGNLIRQGNKTIDLFLVNSAFIPPDATDYDSSIIFYKTVNAKDKWMGTIDISDFNPETVNNLIADIKKSFPRMEWQVEGQI